MIEVTPFTVLIDTREQAPWLFKGLEVDQKPETQLIVQYQKATLKTGDYSLEGFQDEFAIERKSLEDAFQTFGRGRDRFERELERMSDLKFACVIVEADWTAVFLDPPKHSKLKPKTVSRSIIAWSQRYGVHFWLMPTRRMAEQAAYRMLSRWYEDHHEKD